MSAKHDITAEQGSALYVHFQYLDAAGNPIDIQGWSGEMKVRRSSNLDDVLLHLSGNGITAGITGAAGGLTGGVFLHRNMGNTGSLTGGILLFAGSTATSMVPGGIHHYDFELSNTSNIKTRLTHGRFECDPEVTR